MKKFLITLIALLTLTVASAQFRYGPTAGLTVSSLKFKQDLFHVDQAVGGSAGVMAEMMFPGIGFGINFGLNYETRGAVLHLDQREIWSSQGYGHPRSWLHYVDLPVNLRFKWHRMGGMEDYWMPYVYGGPVFDIIMGHSKMHTFDFAAGCIGLRAGIGFEIMRHWQVQGSYTWGVTYSVKDKIFEDFSARSNAWQVGVVYFF